MITDKKIILVFTILIILLKSEVCFSQHSINLSNVDLIVYNKNDTEFRLFEEKSKNKFIELYLDFGDNYNNNFISTEIEYNGYTETLDEIDFNKKDILIYTSDLKQTNISDLSNNSLEIKEKWYKSGEDSNKLILNFLNKSFSVIQELNFEKKEFHGGFGSSRKRNDDNIKKWRVSNAEYYITIDLDFGNDKHIYLLNNRDNTEYLFLPLKNRTYLISDDDGISELIDKSNYRINYLDNFRQFEFEDFISLYKNKRNKYELINSFKKNLFNEEYDTIMYNQFFTIAKKDNQIDIFNSYYEKLNIKNVKSAYLYRSGLEVLNDKGANYYDSELYIIDKFPSISYILCGTVNSTSYKLEFEKHTNSHFLIKVNGGFASELDERRKYYLEDVKNKGKITFLDDTQEYYWDDNDYYMETNYKFPEFIKIKKRKKYGIIEYNYTTLTDWLFPPDTISKDWKKELIYPPDFIKGEIVLPINNDSIKYNNEDGLIYFYRKNKVGLFPRHKTIQYDRIKQKTKSFYLIIRNRKKGWLDIKTNIEHYEN